MYQPRLSSRGANIPTSRLSTEEVDISLCQRLVCGGGLAVALVKLDEVTIEFNYSS